MKKSTPLWCEDCRFVCFETGLGKPMLTLNDPNGLKNTTNVFSIHIELRMALPCQISTGKWKYVNPCLDFLGIPDQRTAYVKRQARPRWTYVRRSSVTPDLVMQYRIIENTHTHHFSGNPPPAYHLDEFESGNEKKICVTLKQWRINQPIWYMQTVWY